MLLNRVSGFNSPRRLPTARLVGTYNCVFTAGVATITVPDADLSPACNQRQILVFSYIETVGIGAVTIDGVNAANLAYFSTGAFLDGWFADYSGDGPFDIVLQAVGSTEDSDIVVFEVDHGDIAACSTAGAAISGTSIALSPVRVPAGSVCIGAAMSSVDTTTLSWTGLTEVVDVDAGGVRVGAAISTTPFVTVPGTDLSVTVNAGSSGTLVAFVLAIPPRSGVPAIRQHDYGLITASGATSSAGTLDLYRLGKIKLVVTIEIEADTLLPGATYDGVALNVVASSVNTGASPDITCRILELDVDTDITPAGQLVITGLSALVSFSYSVFILKNLKNGDSQVVNGNATGAALAVDVEEGGCIIATHARATDTQTITWTGVNEWSAGDRDAGPYRAGLAWRGLCSPEQNRVVQAVGSGSGQYATAAVSFNP